MIFGEHYARLLVLLHTACAIVLVGAATHHGLVVRSLPWQQPRFNLRLTRVYGPVCAISYLATTAFGALAYPAYRYYVRGLYLDRYDVWASRLFDIKEDLAVLGALIAVVVWMLSRSVDAKSGRLRLTIYATLVWMVPLIVWFNLFSGLIINMARSV